METTITKSEKLVSTDKNELNNGIKQVINNIKVLVEKWNYQVTGDLDKLGETDFADLIIKHYCNGRMSKSQLKKLRDLINRVNDRTTIRNSNIFLNYLSKLFDIEKVKIDYSDEEKTIQKSRKEWKELRDKAELARQFYKASKGNFYKDRI